MTDPVQDEHFELVGCLDLGIYKQCFLWRKIYKPVYVISPQCRARRGKDLDGKPGACTLILPSAVWGSEPGTADSTTWKNFRLTIDSNYTE